MSDPSRAEPIQLVRASKSEPRSLDPQQVYDTGSAEITRDLFEGLMRWNLDGELVPAAAESVQTQKDGKLLRFVIRNDAKWSDGSPLVARDFVRGFTHAVDPNTNSPQSSLLSPIRNAKSIRRGDLPPEQLGVIAVSERELHIELEAPTPYFQTLLDYPLTYPRHPAEASDGLQRSNGAYRLEENRPGYATTLSKNSHYWDAQDVRIPSVKYIHLDSESAQVNMFRASEVHMTSTVPSIMTPLLLEKFPDELHLTPQLGTYYYAFNVNFGELKREVLRNGLIAAIDTDEMVSSLLNAGQTAARNLVPPHLWSSDKSPNNPSNLDDRESKLRDARVWLENNGYTHDQPLVLKLLMNTGDNHKKIALYTKAIWQSKLPVSVEIETVDFKVLLDRQRTKDAWDIVRTSWTADFPDPVNFLDTFRSASPNNIPGFQNDEFDLLLQESALSPTKREAYLRRAESIIRDSGSALFLYHYVDRRLVSSRISNFQSNRLAIYRSQDLELLQSSD